MYQGTNPALRSRGPRLDYVFAVAVGLAALAIYWRTLAPGVLGGDSGEFQFAAPLGGVAHPSGYPLYIILGWLWSHLLPWRDAAFRMNLFSALWGAVAVGLVALLAERLLRAASATLPEVPRLLASAVAALAFACSDVFWSQAVVAEIYTLHACLMALVLLLLLRWEAALARDGSAESGSLAAPRLLALVGLTFGFSLTHHLTTLLLSPAVLLFVGLTLRAEPCLERGLGSQRATCGLPRLASRLLPLVSCLLPLVLYLYIPLCAPHTGYLTVPLGAAGPLQLYDQSLRGFLDFVTGRVFAGALLTPSLAWDRLPYAAGLLQHQFGWAGIGLGLLGAVRLAWGRRWRYLMLTGLTFLTLLIFNLFYGIGDIHVFFAAPALILACWIGVGVAAAVEVVSRLVTVPRVSRRANFRSLVATVLVVAFMTVPIVLFLRNLPLVDRSADTRALGRWEAILAQQPPAEAILISNDRDEMMPLWYMQQVEGMRPDITGLFPLIVQEPGWANVAQVAERALDTGRPVFLIRSREGLEAKFNLRPAGGLVQVLGPATSGPPQRPSGLELGGVVRLLGSDLRSSLEPGGVLELALYWQPLREMDLDYTSFVHLLDAEGRKVSQSDHRPGGIYYPTSLWRPGETLLDVHRLDLPQALGPAPHTLAVGFYQHPSLQQLGEPLRIAMP